MNPSTDHQHQSAAEALVASGYEPPVVRVLGNVHDLLAMAKTFDCDLSGMGASGEVHVGDPSCPPGGDPG